MQCLIGLSQLTGQDLFARLLEVIYETLTSSTKQRDVFSISDLYTLDISGNEWLSIMSRHAVKNPARG
jgi:hypothetical protein